MRPSLQSDVEPARQPSAGLQSATRLGFGTALVSGAYTGRETLALLETAYESGIRHFDTAPLYGWGRGEEALGEFAAGKGDGLTIFTKAGLVPPSCLQRAAGRLSGMAAPTHRAHFAPRQIRRSVETSLRKLKRERLDGLLLHEPTPEDVREELVRLLEDMKRSGKIAAVGLAAAPKSTMALLTRYPGAFQIVQTPVASAGKLGALPPGITTIVHSVLGSRLEHGVTRAQTNPDGIRQFEADTGVSPADRPGMARLLLRAALARNPDGVTLFSSSRVENVRRNAFLTPLDAETAAHVATLLGE
ncbi:MAG TPA: aldo/keto reductase [Vitreimonas sp.]|uniref:aldo/keto reductase n=1 Tax=Vitreimonas sp. TaxID=3069702 RepID=UPI002D65FEB3|nr:aldo/keto reductase [Vitreimonas sp.]HYD88946.1 aldo/keto reductase [Vitreimonas sp.]